MRWIRVVALAVTGSALVVSLPACGRDSSDGAKTTSTTASVDRALPRPIITTGPTARQASDPNAPVYCGEGPYGLAVIAYSPRGSAFCRTAISVANAYAHQAKLQGKDWGPGVVLTVTVDDVSWTCQQRESDPDPYQECVSNKNPAETLRLSS